MFFVFLDNYFSVIIWLLFPKEMEALFYEKKMESYEHGRYLCYMFLKSWRPMWCTTLLVAGSVLHKFYKHFLPWICNDTFSMITWLYLFLKMDDQFFTIMQALFFGREMESYFHGNVYCSMFLECWKLVRCTTLHVSDSVLGVFEKQILPCI